MSEYTSKEINILAAICIISMLAFFAVVFYSASNPDKITPASSEIREPAYFWEY